MSKKTIIKASDYIRKATSNDIRQYLIDALKANFEFEDSYAYGLDNEQKDNKSFFYFEIEFYRGNYFTKTFCIEYSLDGVNVSFIGDMFEVKRETTYTEVKQSEQPKEDEKEEYNSENDPFVEDGNLFKSLKNAISKILGTSNNKVFHIEKFNDEKMISYEPLYVPPEVPDAVGEGMTTEESLQMVKQVKEKIETGTMKANLFHKIETECFTWIDCFSNPWPKCTVGEQEVIKNQPVGVIQWNSTDAWELRKSGEIMGPSIEGSAGNRRTNE